MCGCLSCTPYWGPDLDCNPGMFPDWESNQRPFGLQVGPQSTEPHQPGLLFQFKKAMVFLVWHVRSLEISISFQREVESRTKWQIDTLSSVREEKAQGTLHPRSQRLVGRNRESQLSRVGWPSAGPLLCQWWRLSVDSSLKNTPGGPLTRGCHSPVSFTSWSSIRFSVNSGE